MTYGAILPVLLFCVESAVEHRPTNLLKANKKLYALYQMVTLSDH